MKQLALKPVKLRSYFYGKYLSIKRCLRGFLEYNNNHVAQTRPFCCMTAVAIVCVRLKRSYSETGNNNCI